MTPRRVLVIDDCRTVVARVSRALGSDYETRSASGAWEALAEARTLPPDVILLDLSLPAIGGETLAAKLREAGCRAPIVILTSASRAAADQARFRVGAVKSLDKGCSDDVLRMTVSIALLFAMSRGSDRQMASGSARAPLGLGKTIAAQMPGCSQHPKK